MTVFGKITLAVLLTGAALATFMAAQSDRSQPAPTPAPESDSAGCISCHGQTDSATMHPTGTVQLTCVACHGGKGSVMRPANAAESDPAYRNAKAAAHPRPAIPSLWKSSANPVRSAAEWLREDKQYIRFVNPGDLRVAEETCGSAKCHVQEVRAVSTSMMTHGAMLWGAALYNNGSFPLKDAHFGESYSPRVHRVSSANFPRPMPVSPAPKGSSRSYRRSPGGKLRSPAMSCECSNAAVVPGRIPAIQIRGKRRPAR